MPARRIDHETGRAALTAALATDVDRTVLATAVRYGLQEIARRAPGRSVEIRVPPFGAVQAIEGPGHTRGTPPNVIETDARTFVALVTGTVSWSAVVASGAVRASGTRATLEDVVPLDRLGE